MAESEKTTNWTKAIERAKRHPSGQFSDTHPSTLRSIAAAGVAEKLSDGLYYLTDKGWGDSKPEVPAEAPSKVEYRVRSNAMWQLPMDVTGAPDTTNGESGDTVVRPNAVNMGLMPNHETGAWEVTSVSVIGPKVKNGKVVTTRDYGVMFTEPLGEDSTAPEWLREICQDFVDRANGAGAGGGVALTDRQVYDLNNRLNSNLGLQPTREVLEDILGSAPVKQPLAADLEQVGKERFGTSEREGAVWAIEHLRAAQQSAELAFRETGQRDYRQIALTLRVSADELVRELNGFRGSDV